MLGRQEQQRPVAEVAKIDLIKEPVEELRLRLQRAGQRLQRLFHAWAVAPLHHDDDVVFVAELFDVLPPALEVILIGADQVGPLRADFQPGVEGVGGEAAQHDAQRQDQAGPALHNPDQADEQTGNEPRLFGVNRRLHLFREPPCLRRPQGGGIIGS